MNKSKALKIFVPIAIAALIAGIFIYKKASEDDKCGGESCKDPLEIESLNIDDVKGYGKPAMIDFGSETCPPCNAMMPDVKDLHGRFEGKAIIKSLDVSKYMDEVEGFPVYVTPTLFFFDKEGKPFEPSEELANDISFKMYKNQEGGEHILTAHEGRLTKGQMLRILKEMGVE